MMRDELRRIAEPVLREVMDHPFWSGLRDGSLPGAALVHFMQQDTGHLLPTFGRAFARCAAVADHDSHTTLLSHCAFATIESAPRLLGALAELAPRIGVEPPAARSPIAPHTHAYCSFLHAATTTTFAAGIGTLLPIMWFHVEICGDLRKRGKPGSRYAPWIEVYDPGEETWHAVQAFLRMIDEVGERCSATERAQLIEHFSLGMYHEWAFAEGRLRPACASFEPGSSEWWDGAHCCTTPVEADGV